VSISIFSNKVLEEALKRAGVTAEATSKDIEKFRVLLSNSKGDCFGVLYSRTVQQCTKQCIVAKQCREMTFNLIWEVAAILASQVNLADVLDATKTPFESTHVEEGAMRVPKFRGAESQKLVRTFLKQYCVDEEKNLVVVDNQASIKLMKGGRKLISIIWRKQGCTLELRSVPEILLPSFQKLGFTVTKSSQTKKEKVIKKRIKDESDLLTILQIYQKEILSSIKSSSYSHLD